MPKKTMRHLMAAMRLTAGTGVGVCFHRAAAFVLDVPGAELCMGTFAGASEEEARLNPLGSRGDFIHAWVEHKGDVYAPSLLSASNDQMGPFAADEYYAVNGARDISRLTRSDVLRLSGQFGVSAHLRLERPLKAGKRLPEVFLDAGGVQYAVINGGIFPPHAAEAAIDVDTIHSANDTQ